MAITLLLAVICAGLSAFYAARALSAATVPALPRLSAGILKTRGRKRAALALLAAAVFAAATGKPILAAVIGLICHYAQGVYLGSRDRKTALEYEAQVSETLPVVAASVKAGQSLAQALESARVTAQGQLGADLSSALDAVKLGAPAAAVFHDLAAKRKNRDLAAAAAVIAVSKETGGNLAEALNRVSSAILERKRLRGKVLALTSQGRASGAVMSAVPGLLFVLLYLMEPSMTGLMLSTTAGNLMLGAAAAMIAAGNFFIRKITGAGL